MGTRTAPPAARAEDFQAILDRMELYFDAFHKSDARQLATLFHPGALYAFADGDALKQLDMATYLPIVAGRPAPARQGKARDDGRWQIIAKVFHVDTEEVAPCRT